MDSEAMRVWRERLLALRDALDTGEDDRRNAAGTVELDQQRQGRLSRMDAMQMQAMARAEQGRAELQRKRIAAALERIERGVYGDCARCGEPIPEARLKADPAAPLCTDCAQ